MTKIFFILIIFLTCIDSVLAKDCCARHNGISNCYGGMIVCGDGAVSTCFCKNKIFEKLIEKEQLEKEEMKKTRKNKLLNIFMLKKSDDNT